MSRYIDEHRGRFGVEPICRVLGVSASAYYQRASGQRSARAARGRAAARADPRDPTRSNYYAYGARRMWKALQRAGEAVGRSRVERLMRSHRNPGRQAAPQAMAHDHARSAGPALGRIFSACTAERAVGRRHHVSALLGGRRVLHLMLDAYSRRIVGWQFAGHIRTELVLDALRMAIYQRDPGGVDVERGPY